MATASNMSTYHRNSLFDCSGKVALVTGGGSGIGLMIAQTLAVNGAKVYITSRNSEKLNTAANSHSGADIAGELIPVTCDVTDKQQIAELYKDISSREKCLCILVNNAGVAGNILETPNASDDVSSASDMKSKLFDSESATFEDWDRVHRTNVASVYFTTTAFLPLLQKSTELHDGWSGTVINIASISGMTRSAQQHFAYNASKAGVLQLTRLLAAETAATDGGVKVRVNSISPGVFPSEMTAGGESDEVQKSSLPKDKMKGKVPANRPGRDEDMAGAVLFLATNQYVNGQTVVVDGGYLLV